MFKCGGVMKLNTGGFDQGKTGISEAKEIHLNGLEIKKPISPRTTMFFQCHGGLLVETNSGVRLTGGTIAADDVTDFKNKREILTKLNELTAGKATANWKNPQDPTKQTFNTFWLKVTSIEKESIEKTLNENHIEYKVSKILGFPDYCITTTKDVMLEKLVAAETKQFKL